MNNWIAIDFGTSTVKVAYLNENGKPQVLELGSQGEYTMPSAFHQNANGELSIGYEAQERTYNDPKGSLLLLKRYLLEPLSRVMRQIWERYREFSEARNPTYDGGRLLKVEFLKKLFADIRKRATKSVPAFDGKPPTTVCLTITSAHSGDSSRKGKKAPQAERGMLKEAAEQAGFEDVKFVEEPVAAAWAWVAEGVDHSDHVIVIDCGGGTVDWTYIHRHPNTDFRVEYPVSRGGIRIGGSDVDEALYRIASKKMKLGRKPKLMDAVRACKERYCAIGEVDDKDGIMDYFLSPNQIEEAINSKFIIPVCKKVDKFVERVKKTEKVEIVPLLLTGGSSQLKGFKETLTDKYGYTVLSWESDVTTNTVLGAAWWFRKKVMENTTVETTAEDQAIVENTTMETTVEDQAIVENTTVETQAIVETTVEDQTIVETTVEDTVVADTFYDFADVIGDGPNEVIVVSEGKEIVGGLGLDDEASALRARADRIKNRELKLAIVGNRNAGKSTLINVFLGAEVLPMEILPSTAVITEIVHGENKRVQLVYKDGKKQDISRDNFKSMICKMDMDQSQIDVPPELTEIDYAVLQSEEPFYKGGICTVDTPGLYSGIRAGEITKEYLNQVDAALLVLDLQCLSSHESFDLLASLKRTGPSAFGHVFFFYNYKTSPEVKNPEEYKAKLKEVLANSEFYKELHDGDPEKFWKERVFFGNADFALKAKLKNNQGEVLAATGIPRLEKALTEFLKAPGRVSAVISGGVKYILDPVRETARNFVSAQAQDLEKSTEALTKARTDSREKRTKLKMGVRSIMSDFDNSVDKLSHIVASTTLDNLDDWIKSAVREISGKAESYVKPSDSQIKTLTKTISSRIQSSFQENGNKFIEDPPEEIKDEFKNIRRTIGKKVDYFVKGAAKDAPLRHANFEKGLENSTYQIVNTIGRAAQLPPSTITNAIEEVCKGIGKFWHGLINEEKRGNKNQEKVKNILRKELREHFENHKISSTIEEKIKQAIHDGLQQLSKQLERYLDKELRQQEKALDDVLEIKTKGKEKVEAEKERLETIASYLEAKFKKISKYMGATSSTGRNTTHE